MADNEGTDYDNQDSADNQVPPLLLTETIKPFGPRPEDRVSQQMASVIEQFCNAISNVQHLHQNIYCGW